MQLYILNQEKMCVKNAHTLSSLEKVKKASNGPSSKNRIIKSLKVMLFGN